VTLSDLDRELLELFKEPHNKLPSPLARQLIALNKNSLSHPNVELIYDDAFLAIDELLKEKKSFDSIIVDLPDPSHPDLK